MSGLKKLTKTLSGFRMSNYRDNLKRPYLARLWCPRCGIRKLNRQHPEFNSIAKRVPIYICVECGIAESVGEHFGKPDAFESRWHNRRLYRKAVAAAVSEALGG